MSIEADLTELFEVVFQMFTFFPEAWAGGRRGFLVGTVAFYKVGNLPQNGTYVLV